ncbi:Inverted formin-2 [Geodia barretti]|uniref:Inverted formin-2 n=1 Tax=Geodia barretti TaxID=519541 RepID=A0AA35T2U1_GEOBA|nr:Inverted formin-2 [Geodia barretti]
MRYTDSAALLQQVKLYEEGLMRDREEAAMPGGVDITDHQQVFSALFEKVFGTPNAAKLLVILRKMLLIERDTPTGDIIWNGLETMTEAALKIYSDQQAQRVVTSEIVSLRRALEEEAARKSREVEETSGDPSSSSTESNSTSVTGATTDSIPTPSVPGIPGSSPSPSPSSSFNPMSKTVAVIKSVFDKARHYTPTKKMKKINWEKAPDYDAKQSSAVWHGAGEERVKVTVSETHIETFFCQKNEGTDGKFSGKPKKTHLPNQKKALNVSIVLEGMKRDDPTQLSDGSSKTRKKIMTNEEVLEVIRSGRSSAVTLCQATILWEQAPDDKDASFLEPYMDDKSSQTKIGRVEQFMVGLLATPDHTPRLRVLRTKKIFEDLETDYRPTFELLHVATKELMMSRSLKELLHIILLTGNFINGVCERDCPRLLKFHTELPHLDDASRVSVEAVAEELGGWRKEVDELEEIDLDSVKRKGKELARYFCDDRDNFLEEVFLEIRNFSEEFGKTVKETLQENPIVLTPVGPVSHGNPPHSSPSPSPKSHIISSRAITSYITVHHTRIGPPPDFRERTRLIARPSISPLALSSSGVT